jgi:hypothetical protein
VGRVWPRHGHRGRTLNAIVRRHVNHPVTVRLATPKDAEEIALESMAEIEHNLQWEWSPQRVLKAIDDPDTNVVVAVGDGGMLGFASGSRGPSSAEGQCSHRGERSARNTSQE